MFLVATILAPAAHGEETHTIRGELAVPAGHFTVENLVGSMRVRTAAVDRITAVATVHAEDDAVAREVHLEAGTDRQGRPVLRVRYPFHRTTTFRHPGRASETGWWPFGDGRTTTEYDGRRVHLARSGLAVSADVEVQVPARALDATFRNVAGPIEAAALEGTVRLDTGSGDVTVRGGSGDLTADTGSGDVLAEDVEGRFNCDTGSGNCDVRRFRGRTLRCDTGSGEVKVQAAEADDVSVDTGSGDVEIEGRLGRVKADTGSGNVRLRLGPDADFEARADLGSGEIVNRYPDAEPILRRDEVVGYRRGKGTVRISVDTGSGDLVLEPGR
jgi:hypothetical protein